MTAAKPLLELELRPVEAPSYATSGACVFVLLPTLQTLLGAPDFGTANPIVVPGSTGTFAPWSFFASAAGRRRFH